MLSAGIHLFSRGFLLSRMTLENVNDCVHMNLCDDIDNVSRSPFERMFQSQNIFFLQATCLHKDRVAHLFDHDMNSSASRFCFPKKSRVILVVVDALKYEFGLYDKGLHYFSIFVIIC